MAKRDSVPQGAPTPEDVGRTVSGTRPAVRPPERSAASGKETNPMGRDELRALMQRCASEEKTREEAAIAAFNLANRDLAPPEVHDAETAIFTAPLVEPGQDFEEVDALLFHARPAAARPAAAHPAAAPPVAAPRIAVAPRRGYWARRCTALVLLGVAIVAVHAHAAGTRGAAPVARAAVR